MEGDFLLFGHKKKIQNFLKKPEMTVPAASHGNYLFVPGGAISTNTNEDQLSNTLSTAAGPDSLPIES
jgi:hypothetical protein